MKKLSLLLFLSFLALSIFSCRDDYNYDSASKPLRFSKDTVMLDTVFSTVRSETYVLKVYNQQNDDVVIQQLGSTVYLVYHNHLVIQWLRVTQINHKIFS